MKRHLLFVTILAMLAATVAGCAAPAAKPTEAPTAAVGGPTEAVPPTVAPTPVPPPAGPKVLRIMRPSWPDNLDPQKESFVGEIAITQMLYEGLVRLNDKNEVIPGAAEKWESAPDGMSMTFHLRAGLKRADGTPMTAKDFEWAFKRLVDPRTAGEYCGLIDDVVGAYDCRNIDATTASADQIQAALDAVGVKATDDNTLVVNFRNPTGYWTYIATTWVGWPSDPKSVEQDPEGWWAKPELHNGNGLWKVDKWEENKIMTFVPNPNYWGPKPKLDRIEFYFIADTAVSFEAYRKGELDMIILAAEDLNTVKADAVLSKEFIEGPGACTFYLGFHNGKPPFNNREVRKAFSIAVNRQGWVNDVMKGNGVPMLSFIPKGIPGYDETAAQEPYDPKKAVQTLIDAGFGAANSTAEKPKIDCKKLGDIKLTYTGTPRNHLRFQYLAGNFAQVFNCPITLDPVDPTVYTALVKDVKTAPQMFYLGWCSDYPHAQDWLFVWRTGDLIAGRIAYSNPDLDKLIQQANEELDPAKALDLYKQAQKMMLAEYPAGMIYNDQLWFLVKPYVKGPTDHFSSSDQAWVGQFGPAEEYDIDLSAVGAGYPTQ